MGPADRDNVEVEVKLRLASREDHDKVLAHFASGLGETHQQANHFFDGTGGELSARRAVLRVRIYDGDKKATVTLKTKLSDEAVQGGVSRVGEVEVAVPPATAHACVAEPGRLLELEGPVTELLREHGVTGLVGLGGFDNERKELRWGDVTLELDRTAFAHGTLYELECETDDPEALKARMEAELRAAGVRYSLGVTSKYANFINGTLL